MTSLFIYVMFFEFYGYFPEPREPRELVDDVWTLCAAPFSFLASIFFLFVVSISSADFLIVAFVAHLFYDLHPTLLVHGLILP